MMHLSVKLRARIVLGISHNHNFEKYMMKMYTPITRIATARCIFIVFSKGD